MSVFTDEDLKRLKNYAVGYNKDVPSDWLTLHIIASLARLEAAEAVIDALMSDAATVKQDDLIKSWFQSSGRSGGLT